LGLSHLDLLKLSLPPVSVDPNEPNLHNELAALANALDAAEASADALLQEADPRTTTAMMGDWERVYGLPDRCVTTEQSWDQRRAALVSLATMVGEQSRPFFLNIAAQLGFPGATITEFVPASCDSNCESIVYSEDDRSVWRITLPAIGGVFVATCESACDSPLSSWGNAAVECRINRFKPADTAVLIAYQ
jgi:uncharacterized protein YmfQ (DUF2313 family)